MARRLTPLAGCLALALAAALLPAEAVSAGRPSGISGRAVSIACPVTPTAHQTCPRRPIRATIQVLRLPSKRRVATLHSGGAGWFSVDLTPGAYQLTGTTTSSVFAAAPVRTTVHAHAFARVTVTFFPRHPPEAASRVG